MKINRIITAALLLGVTAAHADKYTVDIYNLTAYEGARKVTTQTALAKDSKFRRLPPRKEVTNPTGTATSQRTVGLPQKQYNPGHSEWQVKMDGGLLDTVVVKLKATPGSSKYTQEVSYTIPRELAGKHWKFIIFRDNTTGTIQMCGLSKATVSQHEAMIYTPIADLPFLGTADFYIMSGEKDAKEKARKMFDIGQEWSARACQGFMTINAKAKAKALSK